MRKNRRNFFEKSDEINFEKKLALAESLRLGPIQDGAAKVQIGRGLASTYGDDGRAYFHRILACGSGDLYNHLEADKLYSRILRDDDNYGMGSVIFHLNKLLKGKTGRPNIK